MIIALRFPNDVSGVFSDSSTNSRKLLPRISLLISFKKLQISFEFLGFCVD